MGEEVTTTLAQAPSPPPRVLAKLRPSDSTKAWYSVTVATRTSTGLRQPAVDPVPDPPVGEDPADPDPSKQRGNNAGDHRADNSAWARTRNGVAAAAGGSRTYAVGHRQSPHVEP